MNWHKQPQPIPSGDDPLLIGERSVRLPRWDLVVGVLLACVTSVVGAFVSLDLPSAFAEDEPARLLGAPAAMAPAEAEMTRVAMLTDSEFTDRASFDVEFPEHDIAKIVEVSFAENRMEHEREFNVSLERLIRAAERAARVQQPLACTPGKGL